MWYLCVAIVLFMLLFVILFAVYVIKDSVPLKAKIITLTGLGIGLGFICGLAVSIPVPAPLWVTQLQCSLLC